MKSTAAAQKMPCKAPDAVLWYAIYRVCIYIYIYKQTHIYNIEYMAVFPQIHVQEMKNRNFQN